MDKVFPDISNYDIKKAGEMALYHAHSDLYPFRMVIDTISDGVKVYHQSYYEMAKEAGENKDWLTQDEFMFKGGVYGSVARPLAYYSLVLILVSIIEEAFNTICRAYQLMYKYKLTVKDISGQGIERAILYLEKVVGISGIKSHGNWEYIRTLRDARNMIVHNGGNIPKSEIPKFEKHGFFIDDERHRILFEHDDIIKMYDKTIEFIDTIFKYEPEKSKEESD